MLIDRWGLKNVGITAPNFSWAGPHQVPVNMVFGAPIKVTQHTFCDHGTTAQNRLFLCTAR